jgi:large subunit ribosomal protein L13
MKHTIDAENKKLGRVASEAAKILMGKHTTNFAKNTIADDTVEVINASKLDISEKKLGDLAFKYFSGFAGGLREETLGRAIEKKGMGEVLRKTVSGMLPKNKLRDRIIKHLKVTE